MNLEFAILSEVSQVKSLSERCCLNKDVNDEIKAVKQI